jgi:TetR/AcrR family transcriptional regulator, transcriptional repressor for nem operon
MPRAKSYRPVDLLDAALLQFWTTGYHATSVDDLVRVTGVSRHGIYAEFADKRGLFLKCLGHYRGTVVDPAFSLVERSDATLADIGVYFEKQIALAEQGGLPGPGCLFANSATETAPHDAGIMAIVSAHNQRLKNGFARAIANSGSSRTRRHEVDYVQVGASTLAFANGLWTMSRMTDSASTLRSSAKAFLNLLEMGVGHVDSSAT